MFFFSHEFIFIYSFLHASPVFNTVELHLFPSKQGEGKKKPKACLANEAWPTQPAWVLMCQFVLWMSPILSGRLLDCFSCLPKPQNGRGLRRGGGGKVGDEEEGGLRGAKGQKKQGEGVNASSGEGWGRRPPPENE